MAATKQALDELRGLVERLERDTGALKSALQALDAEADAPEAGQPAREADLADREAFLRMKESLLAEHRGEFVAFANGKLVAVSRSWDELLPSIQAMDPAVDVYVEQVNEEAFLEPPEFDVPGVFEVEDVTERSS
ncbi:MAG: hypothetical protein FJ290_10660 [Planctomycetes bacterium]|nr:hypothetical protein [Planctomycetota bacterium]